MSETMRPLPFAQLMHWALTEYRQEERVFGLPKEKFYRNVSGASVSIFGEQLASPLGPAAGPHTQLAQNIITAYLAGARFMELKTVQKMDGAELAACIPRPCIQAQDEGYNVEWSTELTVAQAFNEYAKAWLAIHALAKEWGLAETRDFAFNISVGYDLAGIQSAKIDGFIEQMKDASSTAAFCNGIAWLRENLNLFERLTEADIAAISPRISNSVTLSTLHGCPPVEIERIAKYLLAEKGLHTYVKCNPTLLGYEFTRRILDQLGYNYLSFDTHHFENDLQYGDALGMLRRLLDFAAERNCSFGVKLTNTFPVRICRAELPGEEMYLSGRALFPLSVNVAAKLARDFAGQLPISYCGGADVYNIEELYRAGLQPLTVATTLLKPGGYARLYQLAGLLEPLLSDERRGVDVERLSALAENVTGQARYNKEQRPVGSRKISSKLPLFDCFVAPCETGGCPLGQQIPAYLNRVAARDYAEAFRIIAIDNALPGITANICNHPCQNKCTRLDYDEALRIREAKLLAVQAAQQEYIAGLTPPSLKSAAKVVVVGAGPAGISAALFLRRNGVAVTVLEQRDKPFGMVEYLIPAFRIKAEVLQGDFEQARKLGVEFWFGVKQPLDLAALRAEYDFVVLAMGAWKESAPVVEQGQELVRDALAFLAEAKARGCGLALGKRVAVIGGGDVAIDCARAARRAPGVEQVSIVYRRTREFMPAQAEEIKLALAEGIRLVELAAPISYDGRTLLCGRMRLDDWDASGRRGVIASGGQLPLHFESVISATGARVDSELLAALGLELDERGRARLDAAHQSSLPNVYVAGDGKAGPATVAEAIGDAKRVALDILAKLGVPHDFAKVNPRRPDEGRPWRRGLLAAAREGADEAVRCLECGQYCGICTEVCPNRANAALELPGLAQAQILHIDGLCNECGNCGVFCPHQGRPYEDKLTLFSTMEDFVDSLNQGFLRLTPGYYLLRLADGSPRACNLKDESIPAEVRAMLQAVEERYPYMYAE